VLLLVMLQSGQLRGREGLNMQFLCPVHDCHFQGASVNECPKCNLVTAANKLTVAASNEAKAKQYLADKMAAAAKVAAAARAV